MKLFGTTTSPFVRRTRVVAAEVGEPVELILTSTPAGAAAVRALSPIGKVPVAELDGRVVFDSRAIIDRLIDSRGRGGIAAPADRVHELNLLHAIEAALDSMLQVFLLRNDGHEIDALPFARRQIDRAATILAWLGRHAPFSPGLDLATVSLMCALEWMDFRAIYPTERHPELAPLRAAWRDHPSLAATRPHT